MSTVLYTIGHSNHQIDRFISLLEDNGVMTVVDVRTSPYSRYSAQFNREALSHVLSQKGMEYAFAGKYLGGRPADASCYRGGVLPDGHVDYLQVVDYAEVMKSDWFIRGIQRLVEMANESTVAIMCSEEDPAKCHRHHLIATYIMNHYPELDVQHIRGDGNIYGACAVRIAVAGESGTQLSLL